MCVFLYVCTCLRLYLQFSVACSANVVGCVCVHTKSDFHICDVSVLCFLFFFVSLLVYEFM